VARSGVLCRKDIFASTVGSEIQTLAIDVSELGEMLKISVMFTSKDTASEDRGCEAGLAISADVGGRGV
jgi:hypothetical protein